MRHHRVDLLGGVPEQALEITDEAVDVPEMEMSVNSRSSSLIIITNDSPFACSLVYDVLVVVVPEAARQLFVVHLGLVLAQSPSTRNLKLYSV